MANLAILFPGQGSQYVGMGSDWYDGDVRAKELFDGANEILGFDLRKICFEGPEEELRQTRNTQPAIFVHGAIVARLTNNREAVAAAGHSLGEYTALVAAGAMSFEDGLRLVRLRGELMQEAGETRRGTMAAIVGLSITDLEAVCRDASGAGIVQPANFNSPGQVVVSGEVGGVQKAIELAKQRGAKLAKELVVSGAFHSPLMESARQGLKEALQRTAISEASIPVYANVTAEPVREAQAIRDLLYRQLTSPVRWEQAVVNMARDGMTAFCEMGPGKVLQGLVKRTNAGAEVSGIDRYADMKDLIRA
jgi:[acyl-carrier-protein] S-malonyltransferase